MSRLAQVGELVQRIGGRDGFEEALTEALDGLAELFGFGHAMMLMCDETGESLYTIASHGYEPSGVGSEVTIGAGVIGRAAAAGHPIRINNLQRMLVYAKRVQASNSACACLVRSLQAMRLGGARLSSAAQNATGEA